MNENKNDIAIENDDLMKIMNYFNSALDEPVNQNIPLRRWFRIIRRINKAYQRECFNRRILKTMLPFMFGFGVTGMLSIYLSTSALLSILLIGASIASLTIGLVPSYFNDLYFEVEDGFHEDFEPIREFGLTTEELQAIFAINLHNRINCANGKIAINIKSLEDLGLKHQEAEDFYRLLSEPKYEKLISRLDEIKEYCEIEKLGLLDEYAKGKILVDQNGKYYSTTQDSLSTVTNSDFVKDESDLNQV